MRKLFLGVYNPSIILTYMGVFFALVGIMQFLPMDPSFSMDTTGIAMILLMLAGICDLFDGAVARMCNRTKKEKQFGIQLDSLADTVSFVLFPAIAIINLSHGSWHSYTIAFFYLFAGIMRLGWFNITTEENKGFFLGLPVTSASLIFPLTRVLISVFNAYIYTGIIFEIVGLLVGVLFILNFKLKKPGIKVAIVWIVLYITTIILTLFV